MPTRARVEAFVATITRGAFLESIPEFYCEDMTARENNDPPRVGREAQVANEKAALSHMDFTHIEAESVIVEGDRVAIHWIFEMTTKGGERIRMDEIAHQVWSGDRIKSERYFYDPAQRRPAATLGPR